uniref:Ion_trans_2 domain-containing protein n=1 Tax=Macrostomum lignano TaxID=282301 RepID=A0A1I8GK37_9PLAT
FEGDNIDVGGVHGNGKQQLASANGRDHAKETTDFGNFLANSTASLNRDDHDKNEEKNQNEGSGAKRFMRRFASIMLSHIGTLLIVVAYVAAGGFLFSYLETNNEIESCKTSEAKFWAKFTETVNLVYSQAQGSNATEAQLSVSSSILDFAKDFYALNVNPEFNCSSMPDPELPTWNFVNAAYFCVTIVTTIGYGHISPMTQWGQIVCMIYGILGIPLMLLFLSKIGDPTAMLFRSFYLNIFCCKCFVKRLPNEAELMANGGQAERQQTSWAAAAEEGKAGGEKKPPAKVVEVIEEEEEEEEEDNEVINIPITVTLMLLTIYIVIGAAVFRFWEEWTIVEGTYFSFITLSTIGFGDYVPGRNGPFNDPNSTGSAPNSASPVEKKDDEDDEDDDDEDDEDSDEESSSTEEEDYESSRGSKKQLARHRGNGGTTAESSA